MSAGRSVSVPTIGTVDLGVAVAPARWPEGQVRASRTPAPRGRSIWRWVPWAIALRRSIRVRTRPVVVPSGQALRRRLRRAIDAPPAARSSH